MKLLLTSGGIRNESLKKVFLDLLGKPVDQVSVAVIPTAAKNKQDSEWFVKDMEDLKATGIGSMEMVEISELARSEWLPKFEAADVIFVEGGDVYLLRDWVVKSGLVQELPRLL